MAPRKRDTGSLVFSVLDLFYLANVTKLWLAKKISHHFLNQSKVKPNQS